MSNSEHGTAKLMRAIVSGPPAAVAPSKSPDQAHQLALPDAGEGGKPSDLEPGLGWEKAN